MTDITACNIWVAVNALGDYCVSCEDAQEAVDMLEGDYGFNAVRVVALNVNIPKPADDPITVDVPADEQPASVKVEA